MELHDKIALEFANAPAESRFEHTHTLLGSAYKLLCSVSQLQTSYEKMISYGESEAQQVRIETSMTDWPTRRQRDVGWAYASICGDGFSEAVAVVSYIEEKAIRIREIEWGRP